MNNKILKIWGERRRLLLTNQTEIDLLYLNKDHYCSTHKHVKKSNKFFVVEGKVKINTEFGDKILEKNESWTVNAPVKHRFMALEDSVMIELAFVNKGKISPDDINRERQGGKILNGVEMTEDEMREQGLLNL